MPPKRKNKNISSDCSKCHCIYTPDDLQEVIFIDYDDLESIMEQMRMRLCITCRIRILTQDNDDRKKKKICSNCISYGFNHPINLNGKCLNCAHYGTPEMECMTNSIEEMNLE